MKICIKIRVFLCLQKYLKVQIYKYDIGFNKSIELRSILWVQRNVLKLRSKTIPELHITLCREFPCGKRFDIFRW